MITKQKGLHDVLPNEVSEWQWLENSFIYLSKIFNYQEIRTPIFESSELFHRAVGDFSDIVKKETYDFLDRGERKITLRPEGTAPIVRSYIENKLYIDNGVAKLAYYGPFFRYERPQKGRYREFHQCGLEAIGSSSILLEVELFDFISQYLEYIDISEYKIKINTLGDNNTKVKYRDALHQYFLQYSDRMCPDCLLRLEKNPLRILDCKVCKSHDFFIKAPGIRDYLDENSELEINKIMSLLDEKNINYEYDTKLVRGLDYYTKTVFEIEAALGDGTHLIIGAGGRYDNLVSDLGGPQKAAVGFSFGLERLIEIRKLNQIEPSLSHEIKVFVLTMDQDSQDYGYKILRTLREEGITSEMDYLHRNYKNQFKLADTALYTIIVGSQEMKEEIFILKNNRTNEQQKYKKEDLIPTMDKALYDYDDEWEDE